MTLLKHFCKPLRFTGLMFLFFCMSIKIGYSLEVKVDLSQTIFNLESQQIKTITGKVTDLTGAPLPGVTVLFKGSTIGVITDSEGKYTLENNTANVKLVFSFVGMVTQEVVIGSQTTINITLLDEVVGLDEVVVIGYGTQKKVSLTSAVSTVENKGLTARTTSNIQRSLQGVVPGLTVIDYGGAPGNANMVMRIRGITT